MPLTLNGKLDLRALPVPDEGPAQAYRAPQTTLQQQLALIWQDVLNVAQVGLDDNFFALGGHSLLATQIIARVRRILGRDVPLRSLFESNSLQALPNRYWALARSTSSRSQRCRVTSPWSRRTPSSGNGCSGRCSRTAPPTTHLWSCACAANWIVPH